MVFYFPVQDKKKYRIWMMTEAESPELWINQLEFKPVRTSGNSPHWFDFGITENLLDAIDPRWGFGQLKFFGITPSLTRNSYFIITSQLEKKLKGDIEEVEESLWGIKRNDVGRTTITPSKIVVGTPTEFILRYETGKKGLPPGSYIRLCIPKAFSFPQVKKRGKAGWLEIVHSDSSIELSSIGVSDESHAQIDAIYYLPEGLSTDGKVTIRYYTNFIFIFKGSFAIMDRRYWYSHLPPLALAVAIDERRIFVPPNEEVGHSVDFIAGQGERIHLFLPGRQRNEKKLKLVGLISDKYRNLPPSGNLWIKFRLVLEGKNKKDIGLGSPAGHFVSRHRFVLNLPSLTPGLYRVKAIDENTGSPVAISNPMEILPSESSKPHIYWGEIHGHSEMSDGIGDFEEMFRHARDEATLDFAAAADHACYFTDNQWSWMQDIVNSFYREGEFATLIGYEWANRGNKQGHRNIYTSDRKLELFRGMHPASRLDVVWKHFEKRMDVVGGAHANSIGNTDTYWEYHNPAVERFYEIYQVRGVFENIVHPLLNKGAILGFTGGGDCHEGHCSFSTEDKDGQGKAPQHGFASRGLYKCGITAALMDRLSRKDLITALRNRKTYATTGARILIDFSISGIDMGDEGELEDDILIYGSVHACDKIERIEVIRDGKLLYTEAGGEIDKEMKWKDNNPLSGKHWYYLKVIQQDGEMAWTSPIWVTSN